MKAIVVTHQAAGTAGITLAERPEPAAASNDVVAEVQASGVTAAELTWPSTWTDRLDRDRTPAIPGQELAGVVTALGYGTRGLSAGQRVFGLTDSYRGGGLAESVAIEARNLAPLTVGVDVQERSAGVIRAGGTLVTIAEPPEGQPADGLAIDFVVLPDRTRLSEIVQRVRDGRPRPNVGNAATLDDAVAALNPSKRVRGQTIIRIRA